MKTKIIYLILFLASISVFANDPLSVSISGPDKIFTNDQVKFTANVVGASSSACSWSTSGGNGTPTGRIYKFTAPSIATVVTIYCTVTIGEGDDQITAEDSMTVTVVVPQITIKRKSYTATSLSGNSSLIQELLTDSTSAAFIHRNILGDAYEALSFSIEIAPTDVKIQKLTITSSNVDYLRLFNCNTLQYLLQPFNQSYANATISSVLSQLPPFRAWGEMCNGDVACYFTLSINNNDKISWNYKIYGIEGYDIETFINPPQCASGLRKNEWACVLNSSDPLYNSLSYAVDPTATYNNKPFLVDTVAPSGWNLSTSPISAAFHALEENNGGNIVIYGYVTSMDTFGNNDGTFSLQDVDSFFMHTYWGSNRATAKNATMDQCKILYYSGHRAARKSSRLYGIYTGWHLFEMKNDADEIIICRPEQATGGNFKFSKVVEKYK